MYGNLDEGCASLINLANVTYARNIAVKNVRMYNYLGRPLSIALDTYSCCIENVELDNVFARNCGSVMPEIARRETETFGVIRNVRIGRLFLWTDDDLYDYLYSKACSSIVIGCDGLIVGSVVGRKATDGPLVRVWSSRSVEIGTIVSINQHDYALDIAGGDGIRIGSVVVIDPRYWGAVVLNIGYSTLRYLRNVVIDNIVIYGNKAPESHPVVINSNACYSPAEPIDNIVINNIYAVETMDIATIAASKNDVRRVKIGRVYARSTVTSGIVLVGPKSIDLEIDEVYAEDIGTNPPDNDHRAVIYCWGSMKTNVYVRRMVAKAINVSPMYGVRIIVLSDQSAEHEVFIESMDEENLSGDITWYDETGVAIKRAIRRNKVYTSLPPSNRVGDTVLYYDGTYYYIAVYNGSQWLKARLS